VPCANLCAVSETWWGLLEGAAAARGDREVLRDDHGRSLTVAQLRDAAEAAAAGLVQLGVGPGDVVSWQLPTTLEAAVLMAAGTRLGVVQNPIIPILREREVGLITRQLGTRLAVVPRAWRGVDHAAMAGDLGLAVLALDLEDEIGPELRLPSGDPSILPAPPSDPSGARWVYYSSGTTAEPKGARHSDVTLIASSRGMVEQLGIGEGDVYPIAWPFTHIGGVTMLSAVLRNGGTLVLFDAFDPATIGEKMAAHRPTILGSAPPFFRAYLDAQQRHGSAPLFPDLRICTGGGAPIPVELNREIVEVLGVPGVVCSWGLTEFPIATCESAATDPDVGSTVGRPSAGVTYRLVDGEIRLKGDQCCLGHVDPALDAEAFDEDGWFRTGDLAEVDEHGRIRITGRLKDVIIRNAENISALEVEEALLRHPQILDAAVIGLPDARTGERVCALVVPVEGAGPFDVTSVAQHCIAEGLAKQKCPEQVEVVDALARNPMGKVLKQQYRDQLQG
jgi:acyl-CoA synthetase (AMP-forming)/AMP-acid ligase II